MTEQLPIEADEGLPVKEDPAPTPNMAPLYAAFAKARGEFPDIPRNRTATVKMKSGGSYSYTYADLADVFKAVNPVLAAYGLAVSQSPTKDGVITFLFHESGAVLASEPWPIKPMPARNLEDTQSYQSAVQATKRYCLTAFLGITTEETVEGNFRTGRDLPEPINDKFETGDGIRLPRGAKIEKGWPPEKIAAEVARAISAQFKDVKTQKGLEGVWDRNGAFIEKLRDKHPNLFSDLFDEFQQFLDEPGEE